MIQDRLSGWSAIAAEATLANQDVQKREAPPGRRPNQRDSHNSRLRCHYADAGVLVVSNVNVTARRARTADAALRTVGRDIGRNSQPDSDHLFRLDIGHATRRVTRWLSALPAGVSVGLSRACWRRHVDRDGGFWNSFRGRRVTDRSGCWTDGDFATGIDGRDWLSIRFSTPVESHVTANWSVLLYNAQQISLEIYVDLA
jgi:hypothetical protein